MTMDVREEERLRKAEREALDKRREALHRDILALAAQPEGRRLFRWLMDQGNMFADDYQPGYMGAYRAGLRATALRLWRALREILPPTAFASLALGADSPGDAEGCGGGEAHPRDFFPAGSASPVSIGQVKCEENFYV